jgi:uncharacterized protein (TIGR03067 family)
MRRTILLLAGVLLSVVALGSDSPKGYDDRTELAGIEGTWRLIEFGTNGRKQKPGWQDVTTYRRGTIAVDYLDGRKLQGSYRIDRTQSPPHLDRIVSNTDGQTLKSLCRIDSDTLRIATLPDSGRRPESFDGKDVCVWTYKRVK